MLARIHTDHRHISTLLAVLARKVIKLRSGQEINLSLVRDVVDYLQRYADRSHHPMEDILYQYYLDKKGESGDVHRLAMEHRQLQKITEQLFDTLTMILNDAVVPRDRLIDEIDGFVEIQRKHLQEEEGQILPLLEEHLDDNDWETVRKLVANKLVDDPLFGESGDREYEDLRAYLVDAEME